MHRIKVRLALASSLLAIAVAAIALLAAVSGGSGALASGSTPTNTPGNTPTPKPTDQTGDLTGVYDIVIDNGSPGTVDLFHCIGFIAHNGSNDQIKSGLQCYDNTGAAGDANAEPLDDAPGEGPSGDSGAIGPPPPPPYTQSAPFKAFGTYTAGDDLTLTACISEIGGPLGPNIIAVLDAADVTATLLSGGSFTADVSLYPNQTDANCETGSFVGTPFLGTTIATTFYPAYDDARCPGSVCDNSDWRGSPLPGGSQTDWDGDGCTDVRELDKNSSPGCGDDPWNPNDTSLLSIDVAGDYTLVASAVDVDCNPALSGNATTCELPADLVPGLYYSCIANIAQTGKALTAMLGCYIDTPGIVINPQMAKDNSNAASNPTACGPGPTQAPSGYCGDGSPLSPPPGITIGSGTIRNFADIDTSLPVLTGVVDNAKQAIVMSGCFADVDGISALGNTYARATVDINTGHGWAQIFPLQTTGDCNGGTPTGSPGYVPIDLVRQTKDSVKRDSDSDGCADRKELRSTGTQGSGGLRDPWNHYDYMNPTNDGLNRVDDILATVGQYFDDDADATPGFPPFSVGYNQDTDRTALVGGNAWNLGNPNGQQRVDDILASVKQYFHDCNTA